MFRCLGIVLLVSLPAFAEEPPKPTQPGPVQGGGFLLPNGWTLTPAGQHAVTTDLPLNIIPLKDNKHAIVACSGFNAHDLLLVDITGEPKIVSKITARQSWFGLAMNSDESKLWWSGGGGSPLMHTIDLKDGKLTKTSEGDVDLTKLTPAEVEKLAEQMGNSTTFKSGLFLDPKSNHLYSLDIHHQKDPKDKESPKEGRLHITNLKDNSTRVAVIGGRPYDVIPAADGKLIYVSDWAGRRVLVVDAESMKVVQKIPVGEHPNQMALDRKRNKLYVANATSNSISKIDCNRGIVVETIYTALFPESPGGEHAGCARPQPGW